MLPLNETASNHCICLTVFPASSTAFRTASAKLSFDSPTISMTFQTNPFTSANIWFLDHSQLIFVYQCCELQLTSSGLSLTIRVSPSLHVEKEQVLKTFGDLKVCDRAPFENLSPMKIGQGLFPNWF